MDPMRASLLRRSRSRGTCSCRRWYYEVYKRVSLQRGTHAALQAASTLQHGRTVELTATLALAAARLSQALKLPMADSIILASARAENAVIWTQDSDFQRIPGVKFRAKKT